MSRLKQKRDPKNPHPNKCIELRISLKSQIKDKWISKWIIFLNNAEINISKIHFCKP